MPKTPLTLLLLVIGERGRTADNGYWSDVIGLIFTPPSDIPEASLDASSSVCGLPNS